VGEHSEKSAPTRRMAPPVPRQGDNVMGEDGHDHQYEDRQGRDVEANRAYGLSVYGFYI
jgi:hypothetical protein